MNKVPVVERVGDVRCQLGEGAVWRHGDQSFWWTDIEARRLWRWTPVGNRFTSWEMPEMTGCMAPLAAADNIPSGWVLAMETGLFLVDEPMVRHPVRRRLARVEHPALRMRFNDGRCDPHGRFWACTMSMDPRTPAVGQLYRFGGGVLSGPLLDDLRIGNGLAFSPDGRTMYLSDSDPRRDVIWAMDYDLDLGLPYGERRVFVDHTRLPGVPDGAAVDVDGGYWSCANGGGRVQRFTPDGRLDRSIEMPVANPTLCVFGGPDRDLMFITTAAGPDPLDGAVFITRPGTQGAPVAELSFRP